MELQQAIEAVKAAGYRVTKPAARKALRDEYATTNPFNHPFPHAKLKNITLTSPARLSRWSKVLSQHMTA